MSLHPDDPKWTAFALGELEEAEKQSLSTDFMESEEARVAVREIEELAGQLTQALHSQDSPGLTEAQRSLIRQVAAEQENSRWHRAILRVGLPIAAALFLTVSVYVLFRASRSPELGPGGRGVMLPPRIISPSDPGAGTGHTPTASDNLDPPVRIRAAASPTAPATLPGVPINPDGQTLLSLPEPDLALSSGPRHQTPGLDRPFEEQLFLVLSIPPPNDAMIASGPTRVFGTVKDPSGAVIQGAKVEIRSLQSGLRKSANSDLVGRFEFEGIDPGPIELKAELSGFKVFSERQDLPSESALQLDPVLQVGEIAQTVEVSSAPTTIQADSSSVSKSGSRPFSGWFSKKKAPAVPPPAKARIETTSSNGGVRRTKPQWNTESYNGITDNPFLSPRQEPLSTFSIDVDTASYSNVRRFLNSMSLPPKDAVRIEEMVNYFTYAYPEPTNETPFAANVEVGSAPWAPAHRLVRIGLKGREVPMLRRPPSNLVFLIDVSGSMNEPNKLPLVKRGLQALVQKLGENDRLAIVVYAGSSGLVLPSTRCDQQRRILALLEDLRPGGSTNGAQGIRLAYDIAVENFVPAGVNRVILATDGDFNVGITSQGDLTRLIEEKAKSGVFLSVLGFGMGNIKDSMLEKLADKGNGHYAYIDSLQEAHKVLVEEMGATLVTIAKDVKIQVEFNPAHVGAYRLIGYENRILAAEDFNDDRKDAGEIGAGHTVTALYEVVPPGNERDLPGVDPLKYQSMSPATKPAASSELLTVKLRYKHPSEGKSHLLEIPVTDRGATLSQTSADFRFAAAVAAFGMVLRDSPYKGDAIFKNIVSLAEANLGDDKSGYRREFLTLVQKAAILRHQR